MKHSFTPDDFIEIKRCYMSGLEEYIERNYRCYNLNQECIIMHRLLDWIEPIEELAVSQVTVMVYYKFELSGKISQISEYISWLGSKCRDEFIRYFWNNSNKITDANKRMGSEWYDSFDLISVTIEIDETNKTSAFIEGFDHCMADRYYNTITLEEKTIISIERENRGLW